MTDFTQMDRRQMMQRLMLLVGAAAMPAGEALAAPRRKAKSSLSPARMTLLSAIADTIIPRSDSPGALDAGVPKVLDGMLTNWASPQHKAEIIGAIDRIDAASRGKHKVAFAKLSPGNRKALLTLHDIAALKPVPRPANAPSVNPFVQQVYVTDQGYFRLKDLVISLYYFSEVATSKELIYEHIPGKFEPSIKLTAQSRPHLGTGPF